MTLKGPEFKKALLLALVVAVVPLVYYPNSWGWLSASPGGARILLLEVLYYLVAFHFLLSRESMAHRAQAAAVSVGFRLGMGTVFGLVNGGLFGAESGTALREALYAYLPAVLLHVAVVPYLLRPVFQFREARRPRAFAHLEPSQPRVQNSAPAVEAHAWAGSEHVPDFDAAVTHVASYSSVGLAMLVDEEGLCVARASRGAADSDLWAPVVNLLYASVVGELRRTSDADVRRLQVTLAHERLVVERVEPFYLAVLCDQNSDDLVNVRITQSAEMIRKYYEHKYRKVALEATAEVAYV